jgi:hypothetical protein
MTRVLRGALTAAASPRVSSSCTSDSAPTAPIALLLPVAVLLCGCCRLLLPSMWLVPMLRLANQSLRALVPWREGGRVAEVGGVLH